MERFMSHGCVQHHNNPMIYEKKKYAGVVGYLFVMDVDKSIQRSCCVNRP